MIKKNIFILFLTFLFFRCDNICRKDYIFNFSYPNDNFQKEYVFNIDFSEISDGACVAVGYDVSISNCSQTMPLQIEMYDKFYSETEYFMRETLEISPLETKNHSEYVGSPSCFKARSYSLLVKGLNSDCFYGEINIHPRYITDKCHWGEEEGWYIEK